MKDYYNALLAFTQVNNRTIIDESLFDEVSRTLYKTFKDLEVWEQDMLQHTICFEVSEVIL